MARITHRLTALAVTNAKAKGLYSDGGGLYLRVTSTGTKSWILRFKCYGTTRDMGLGPLGAVSLARARELAAEAGRKRLEGLDPIKARADAREAARRADTGAVTFSYCAERLVASHEPGWRNPTKHAKLWRNTLKTYAEHIAGEMEPELYALLEWLAQQSRLEVEQRRKPEEVGREILGYRDANTSRGVAYGALWASLVRVAAFYGRADDKTISLDQPTKPAPSRQRRRA